MRSVKGLISHRFDRGARFAAVGVVAYMLLAAVLPPAAAAASGNWEYWQTPEDAGFSSAALAQAEAIWNGIDDAPVSAFFLVYKGKVLAAFGDVTADHQCHSVRKSFLSALYGVHVDKGTIDLEATLEELGIDDSTPLTEAEKQAKVIDLLGARSGVYIEAACEAPEMKEARPERGSHAPGTFWYYNNWDFNALGTIFRDETGRDIFQDFKTKIATPTGMQDFKVSRCSYAYEWYLSEHPCYVFRMSARDRARFGQLFLQGGRWGNRQIIPESWVIESTTVHSLTRQTIGRPGYNYGLMWWVQSPKFFRQTFQDSRLHHLSAFSANGYGGQLIMALPEADMVVVFAVDVPAGGDLTLDESLPVIETILTGREIVDLKLKQTSCREQTVFGGDMLHLTAKVKNLSSIATQASTVTFYLTSAGNDSSQLWVLGNTDLPRLAPKKSKTLRLEVTLSGQAPPGRYRMHASVDHDNINYDLKGKNDTKTAKGVLEVR